MIKLTPSVFNHRSASFKSDDEKIKKEQKYTDPLMQWPARGLAYSNELGAALREVTPKLGVLLWFPAMLYFGADIYDKYKNEKTSFNPNAQRGTEQAIFQLLASIILPTAAVILGQKTASVLGAVGKSGLSLQTREEVIEFLRGFESRRHLYDFDKENEKFKKGEFKPGEFTIDKTFIDTFKFDFVESLSIKRDKLLREHKIKNPFKSTIQYLFGRKHEAFIALSHKQRIFQFADENIDEVFKMFVDLVNGKKPAQFSKKMWKNFLKLKTRYAKDPEIKGNYICDAAEDIIIKFQKRKMMNSKILKTIGGFIALGLAIKPIDKFVENVIIKKLVSPNLNLVFNNLSVQEYKEKHLGN